MGQRNCASRAASDGLSCRTEQTRDSDRRLWIVAVGLSLSPGAFAAEQPSSIPAWLMAHVGEGDGQIAQVVLQRARALYLEKTREGLIRNPCYLAMDATRPHKLGDGKVGDRFYIICESE